MKLESNVCHAVLHLWSVVGELVEGCCTPYGALYCLSRCTVQSIEFCPAQRKGALTGIKRTNFPEKGRFGESDDVRTGREQGLGSKSDRGTTTTATHHQPIHRIQQALACMDALYGRTDRPEH